MLPGVIEEIRKRVVRLVDRMAVQVDVALHRPLTAPAQAHSYARHRRASSSRKVWPSVSPLRSQGAGRFKIRLGVERRHAAGPGGSHRLPVDVIGDVARGKYPGDRRCRRVAFAAAFYLDVTADHVELTFEE